MNRGKNYANKLFNQHAMKTKQKTYILNKEMSVSISSKICLTIGAYSVASNLARLVHISKVHKKNVQYLHGTYLEEVLVRSYMLGHMTY